MTRTWAPLFKSIQDAIAAAIEAEYDEQRGDLPKAMRDKGLCRFAVGLDEARLDAYPYSWKVVPAENSPFTADVTEAFEAGLEFPVQIRVKALGEVDCLEALREAVGLVLDAIAGDTTLGGLTAGPADPAFRLGAIATDGAQAIQEVAVRLVVRAAA